jgi:hypothetical protein
MLKPTLFLRIAAVEKSPTGLMVSPLCESTTGLTVSPLPTGTMRRKLHWNGVPASRFVAPGLVLMIFFSSRPARARFTDSRPHPVEIASTRFP